MRVIHVVATNERRGAEIFASDLVGAIANIGGVDQRVLIVRANGAGGVSFAASEEVIGGYSRPIPGVGIDIGAARRVRGSLTSEGADVIVAHGGDPLKHVLTALRGDGRSVVYRRIGDARQFASRRLQELVFAAMLRRTSRVVAVADALRRELIARYGLAADRVVAIPNGVDPAAVVPTQPRSTIRQALGISPDVSVVLSLGALTWEKDPLSHVGIVRRAASLAKAPVVHLFAGDGPLRPALEREASHSDMGYDGRVLGSRSDIGDLLAASDALLLASRTEGMPAAVIEAGMAGVPVAGYALSGVPEVVVDGLTGLLAPPGNAVLLAGRVAKLLQEPQECARLGSNAAERCRGLFSIDAIAPRYLRVFEDVARASRTLA